MPPSWHVLRMHSMLEGSRRASMVAPVALPAKHDTGSNHCAGQVANARRRTPGRCSRSAGRARGSALECRSPHQDVPLRRSAASAAEQRDQPVSGAGCGFGGAGVTRAAAPVHFAGCDAGQPYLGAFRTPDRPITVPDSYRCAGKGQSRRQSCPDHFRTPTVRARPFWCMTSADPWL